MKLGTRDQNRETTIDRLGDRDTKQNRLLLLDALTTGPKTFMEVCVYMANRRVLTERDLRAEWKNGYHQHTRLLRDVYDLAFLLADEKKIRCNSAGRRGGVDTIELI